MYVYRQHPIALAWAVFDMVALSALSVAFWRLTGATLLALALGSIALLLLAWRVLIWATFSLRVENGRATLHILGWFVVHERMVALHAPGGVRLRQNLAGFLFDYGNVVIESFNEPVAMAYLAPFSVIKRQLG